MSTRLELVTGRATTPHVLRPATPDDAPRLVTMFERCSPATRYGRFLAPLQHFPAAHLTDVVCSSPLRHSWVVEDVATGDVVGVGSWFRNQRDRSGDAAEVALLIEDAVQTRGLGTALLDQLAADARGEGITTFVADTLADARHVHRMLGRIGPTTFEGTGTSRTWRVALVAADRGLTGPRRADSSGSSDPRVRCRERPGSESRRTASAR